MIWTSMSSMEYSVSDIHITVVIFYPGFAGETSNMPSTLSLTPYFGTMTGHAHVPISGQCWSGDITQPSKPVDSLPQVGELSGRYSSFGNMYERRGKQGLGEKLRMPASECEGLWHRLSGRCRKSPIIPGNPQFRLDNILRNIDRVTFNGCVATAQLFAGANRVFQPRCNGQ